MSGLKLNHFVFCFFVENFIQRARNSNTLWKSVANISFLCFATRWVQCISKHCFVDISWDKKAQQLSLKAINYKCAPQLWLTELVCSRKKSPGDLFLYQLEFVTQTHTDSGCASRLEPLRADIPKQSKPRNTPSHHWCCEILVLGNSESPSPVISFDLCPQLFGLDHLTSQCNVLSILIHNIDSSRYFQVCWVPKISHTIVDGHHWTALDFLKCLSVSLVLRTLEQDPVDLRAVHTDSAVNTMRRRNKNGTKICLMALRWFEPRSNRSICIPTIFTNFSAQTQPISKPMVPKWSAWKALQSDIHLTSEIQVLMHKNQGIPS